MLTEEPGKGTMASNDIEVSMGTHVSLGNHFEGFVKQMLQSGRYNNASEVLRDSLRMLEEREAPLKHA